MLEASVNETQGLGVDIHELAPGCCFVPWWNNATVISIPEHVEWWTTTFNNGSLPPNRTEGFMESVPVSTHVHFGTAHLQLTAPFSSCSILSHDQLSRHQARTVSKHDGSACTHCSPRHSHTLMSRHHFALTGT